MQFFGKGLCLEKVLKIGGMDHKIMWPMKKKDAEIESKCPVLDVLSYKGPAKLKTHECEFVMVDPRHVDRLVTTCELEVVVLAPLPLLEGLIKRKKLGLAFDQKSMLLPVHFINFHDCDE